MHVFSRARRGGRRAAVVSAVAGLIVLVLAAPAGAHVTVSVDDTTQGADDAILTFRVPNEQDAAVTRRSTSSSRPGTRSRRSCRRPSPAGP
jgi:hypothetical protein